MFAIERTRIIKNCLMKDHKVSVAKLSELLNVTEVTIRRDLEKMEKEGILKRTHGGAVLVSSGEESFSDEPEFTEDTPLYQEIAETAYHIIQDTQSILLTSGPVNQMIARSISARSGLTVVTNDIQIASVFSHSSGNSLIFLGGDLDDLAVYGQMTSDNLRNFSFNHTFIEVDAVSETAGIMVSSMKKATLIQQAVKNSESITLVCPSRFFGQKSLYRVGPVSMVHRILTDSYLDDQYKKYLFDQNLPVFTSIDVYED